MRALDFASRAVPVVARIDALQMAPSVPSNLGLFQSVRMRFMIDVAFDVPLVERGVIARAEVGRNRFEAHQVGDRLTVWVDPANPRGRFGLPEDAYDLRGMFWGLAGMVASALAVLALAGVPFPARRKRE